MTTTATNLFVSLTDEELQELSARLSGARDRALDMTYEGLDDESHGGANDPRYVTYQPVYYELDSVYMLVFNESYARYLGCRWQACTRCRHESCVFCHACNPGEIAPNGEAYGDVEDETAVDCCCA